MDITKITQHIKEHIVQKFGDEIVAIYGIGSAFESIIPHNDVDVVVILTTLDNCVSHSWTPARYEKEYIGRVEITILYGTLEGYKDEGVFKTMSFANWAWSVRGIKYGSTFLYGTDIRDQLGDPPFDYDDILKRSAYHLEPSPQWKMKKYEQQRNPIDEKMRFTKAVFKYGFFVVASLFPDENIFHKEGVFRLLNDAYERELIDGRVLDFYEMAMDYRQGVDIPEFKDNRDMFIQLMVKETLHITQRSWDDIKQIFDEGFNRPFSYIIRRIDREGWEL